MKKDWGRTGAVILGLLYVAPTAQAQTTAPSSASEEATHQEQPEHSEPPPPSERQITRPVALHTPIPPLPGKWEPAEVVLELTIDAEGFVVQSKVVSGDEPFAGAALSSLESWRFTPAAQDGQAVSAKIHFLITFKPSEAVDAPGTSESEDAPLPEVLKESQATTEEISEVVVRARYGDPGATSFSRAEVQNLPGAFGDPLRAIEVMPGVTPIASGLPMFFIRGAPPGNVGYFVDGIRVPLLYHAFLGPSVLNPAFIEAVNLSAGPMPAAFGRYAGAAVEVEMAEPEREFRAEGNLRLLDVGGFVQAPIDKGRGYVQAGGRYSYTALLASLFSPGTRIDYWDYQGLVGYALTPQDEVSLLAMGAYDYVGNEGEVLGATEFHRLDFRWNHDFSNRTEMRLAGTWGRDRTRTDSGYLSDHLLGTRFNLEHSTDDHLLRGGADLWFDKYKMDVDPAIAEPEIYLELFPSRTDVSGGVWVDAVLFTESKIQVIPGIRTDIFHSLGETRVSVDPRISAEYKLTERLRAIHSLGVTHQSPNFVPNVPGAQVAGLDNGLQQSLQAATKYVARLPWELTASVAGFINGTKQLTDPIGLDQSFSIDEQSGTQRSLGRAFGLEFFLKRNLTKRLGGMMSYTFSQALRSYDNISTQPGYNRPHVFNGALTYDFGYNIRASTKLAISSGVPGRITTLDGFVYAGSRSKPFIRLDAKVEKRWIVSEHLEWGTHLEILNATYSPNVTTRTCTVDGCENGGTAPITFPSIGVDVAWN